MSPVPPSPEVFNDLVREHQSSLRGLIRALGVESLWVDDLAQEAFLIAHREYQSFDSQKDFGRWLRGIARNLVANERRKEAPHARLLDGPFTDLMLAAQPTPTPPGPTESQRLLEVMNGCIGELPERSRELLRLRYQGADPASVVAVRFQMSREALRQWLVRLRAQVRQCMQRKLAWP
ncbi:MAG TPA: sigma-70 family RNA polymerase sigma factor [Verrucomicrobiota bacterium]|nr:RNA polymerase factor sigma-70 [Verrucomicrobiales bacterium]HRI11577.1 sigma-70 family RNA polymerase sigma factor [Verrucomicrobiota bacterium]